MYFKHKKLIQKICKGICTMAVFAAPVASEYCHVLFYQPKEPEGFKEFLKKEQKENLVNYFVRFSPFETL